MIPIRTRRSTFVYRGPSPDIGDAWVERAKRPGASVIYIVWQLTEEERQRISDGENLKLGIWGLEPIPPVSLETTPEQEISEAGAALRDRATKILRGKAIGPPPLPSGYWIASEDVWEALERDGALDETPGVPTLFGRPLMAVVAPRDSLDYFVAPDVDVVAGEPAPA